MKNNWKTLFQAMIISVVVVVIYAFLVIYALANQTMPGPMGKAYTELDFGNPLVLESLPGITLVSLYYFCILTLILFLVIFVIKKLIKRKK